MAGMKHQRHPSGPAGKRLRADHKDGPQLIRSTGKRWSEEAEIVFLDEVRDSILAKIAAFERAKSAPGFPGKGRGP